MRKSHILIVSYWVSCVTSTQHIVPSLRAELDATLNTLRTLSLHVTWRYVSGVDVCFRVKSRLGASVNRRQNSGYVEKEREGAQSDRLFHAPCQRSRKKRTGSVHLHRTAWKTALGHRRFTLDPVEWLNPTAVLLARPTFNSLGLWKSPVKQASDTLDYSAFKVRARSPLYFTILSRSDARAFVAFNRFFLRWSSVGQNCLNLKATYLSFALFIL